MATIYDNYTGRVTARRPLTGPAREARRHWTIIPRMRLTGLPGRHPDCGLNLSVPASWKMSKIPVSCGRAWRRRIRPGVPRHYTFYKRALLISCCSISWRLMPSSTGMAQTLPELIRAWPRPMLRLLFIAWGRRIKPGIKLSVVNNIDVAPTIAALLGESLPSADGKGATGDLRLEAAVRVQASGFRGRQEPRPTVVSKVESEGVCMRLSSDSGETGLVRSSH